jgi:hypothetical protein
VVHLQVDDAESVFVAEAFVELLDDLFKRAAMLLVDRARSDRGDRIQPRTLLEVQLH